MSIYAVSEASASKLSRLMRQAPGESNAPLSPAGRPQSALLRIEAGAPTAFGYPATLLEWDFETGEYLDSDLGDIRVGGPDFSATEGQYVEATPIGGSDDGDNCYRAITPLAGDYAQITGTTGASNSYEANLLIKQGLPSTWTTGAEVRVLGLNGERLFVGRKYRVIRAVNVEIDGMPVYVTSIECCDDAVCQELPAKSCGSILWADEYTVYCYGTTFGMECSPCTETLPIDSPARIIDLSTSFSLIRQIGGNIVGYLLPQIGMCGDLEPPSLGAHSDGNDRGSAIIQFAMQWQLNVTCIEGQPGFYRLTLSMPTVSGSTAFVWGSASESGPTTLDVGWDELAGPHVGSAWYFGGSWSKIGDFSISIELGAICNQVANGMTGGASFESGQVLVGNGTGPIRSSDSAEVQDDEFRIKIGTDLWMGFGEKSL